MLVSSPGTFAPGRLRGETMASEWRVGIDSEIVQGEWQEDYYLTYPMYFLTAATAAGRRFVNAATTRDRAEAEEWLVEAEMAVVWDNWTPEDKDDWAEETPVYGSDLYRMTGGDEAHVPVEDWGFGSHPIRGDVRAFQRDERGY